MVEIRRAERKKAKLRLGISAPSGAGKTLGSLLLAYGILREQYPDNACWDKIALIDTEEGSGELYVGVEKHGVRVGAFNYIRISAPFTIAKYIEAIRACERAGIEVIILDSISHAWTGAGGILDKQGQIADASKNSYTAWRHVTPEHNSFIDSMLQSPAHIIATMRSKTEYVMEANEKGKLQPRKIGMAPVQREGMEYEFTVVFDIDFDSVARALKDRTDMFSVVDGAGRLEKSRFMITADTGHQLYTWLNTGVEVPKPIPLEGLCEKMAEAINKAVTVDEYFQVHRESEHLLDRMRAENIGYFNDMIALMSHKYSQLTGR